MPDEYPILEALMGAESAPLWDIQKKSPKKRKAAIVEVYKAICKEHARSLDDDSIGPIEAGVLLGARSLVGDLLLGSEDK